MHFDFLRRQNQTLLILFTVLLFIVAPLNTLPSIGGQGLGLPINISIWFVALWFISIALFLSMVKREFYYPKLNTFILAPIIALVFSAYIAGVEQPTEWLFRLLFIVGGVLFFYSLFQFKPSSRQIEQILYCIIIFSLIDACLSLANYYQLTSTQVTTTSNTGGIFGQANIEASFLVTTVLISFYLISRPSFSRRNLVAKSLLIVSVFVSSHVVFLSGSRIGLLSLFIGGVILFVSRYRLIKKQKKFVAILMLIVITAGVLGNAGIHNAINKSTIEATTKINEAESVELDSSQQSLRLNIYRLCLDLFKQAPFFGHGIGSFQRVWVDGAEQYSVQNPGVLLEEVTLTHPHNETLFWMVEGGVVAVSAICLFVIGLVVTLFKLGFERGGAYAALLIPISLHTQVELPFYLSAYHWFLWSFLVFMIYQHHSQSVLVNISQSAIKLVKGLLIIVCIGGSYFLIQTSRAQADIYQFVFTPEKARAPYLQQALGNLYFRDLAVQLTMKASLYQAIEVRDKARAENYIEWAESEITTQPTLMLFLDLIKAYRFLGLNKKACQLSVRGSYIYTNQQGFIKQLEKCP